MKFVEKITNKKLYTWWVGTYYTCVSGISGGYTYKAAVAVYI